MKKEEALQILFQCADKYEENLANKNLLLICVDKQLSLSSLELVFNRGNFLHMTGIKFKDDKLLPANQFYKMCLKRRLSINDFELAKDGTTEMKLRVLPALVAANLSANMVGDYSGSRPMLYTDKIAGNVKGCIGLLHDEKRNLYVPNTVLNEDIRKLIMNVRRVIAVYRKDIKEKAYTELVYKARNVDESLWNEVTNRVLTFKVWL